VTDEGNIRREPATATFHERLPAPVARHVPNRLFGMAVAAGCLAVAFVPALFGGSPRWAVACVAALFAGFAAVYPRLLGPLNWAASRVARQAVRWFGFLVMGLAFALVVTPVALLFRLLRRNELRLGFDRGAGTYWEPRSPGSGDFREQF
jgi:hypothetical protein